MTTCVVGHTKKKNPYGDRFIPLNDYDLGILEIIKAINKDTGLQTDNFVFCGINGRRTIRSIDHVIRKMCAKAKIEVKSAHDIRRTVASEMHANGVPVETIREFLGHANISQTYEYIVNHKGKKETARLIHESLSSMCGLVTQGNSNSRKSKIA